MNKKATGNNKANPGARLPAWMVNRRQWSPNVPGVFETGQQLWSAGECGGGVVSEVGQAEDIKTWFGTVGGYTLRKSRISARSNIHHGFGQAHIGEAWTAPDWSSFDLPAAGSRVVLSPKIPNELNVITSLYKGWVADCTWILRCDMPLGCSFQLRVFAPEINSKTTTRGVVWKPGTVDTVPFFVGWSSPVPRFSTASSTAMKAHPGLSLVVECVEDNSEESVSRPIKIQAFAYVHNVHCYSSINDGNWVAPSNLALQEVNPTPPPPSQGEELLFGTVHMADVEAPNSGNAAALGDTAEVGIPPNLVPMSEEPGPVDTVQTAKKPGSGGEPKPVTAKPQTQATNQKWYKLRTLSLSAATAGKVQYVTVTPAALALRGDSPGNPFRRNVFQAGAYRNGLCTGLEFKIVSHRPPQVAATIALFTNGENFTRSYRYFHVLGGEATIVPVMPDAYVNLSSLDKQQNLLVSPWIRSSTAKYTLGVEFLFVNQIQSVKDQWITIYVRPGDTRFQVPVKPKPAPTSNFDIDALLAKDAETLTLRDIGNLGVLVGRHHSALVSGLVSNILDGSVQDATDEQQRDSKPETAVTGPVGVEEPYEGLAGDQGDPDKLSQDDTWVRVADIKIPIDGKVKAITLPLWSLKDDGGFTGGISPIHEKLERHIEVEPTSGGVYGPTIGHYQIKLRPPAGVTMDVVHTCLPPEMNEESALRIFGIDSLLSVAGNMLQSVGGSLLNGAIDTVGNVLGSAVDSFLTGHGGDSGAPEERAPGLAGDIPVSRYIEFIRTIAGSAGSVDYWPTLLMQAVNFMNDSMTTSKAVTEVPASVYVRMCNVPTRRNVYDRDVVFEPEAPTLKLNVTREQFGAFMFYLGQSSHPKAKALGKKCLSVLAKKSFPYDLATLESEVDPSVEEVKTALTKVKTMVGSPSS